MILTTGTGFDIHIEEAHVINTINLKEIEVKNFVDIISKNITTKIEKSNDVDFNSWIHYYVINNKLKAEMGVQVSPSMYVCIVTINYEYLDSKLNLNNMYFSPSK